RRARPPRRAEGSEKPVMGAETTRTPSIECDGSNLAFVVGCPRSGTTWVQRLLATHPRVRTGQESYFFGSYIGPQLRAWKRHAADFGRGAIGPACYFSQEEFLAILGRYAAMLLAPMVEGLPPGGLFVEKTPQHGLFIPEIVAL